MGYGEQTQMYNSIQNVKPCLQAQRLVSYSWKLTYIIHKRDHEIYGIILPFARNIATDFDLLHRDFAYNDNDIYCYSTSARCITIASYDVSDITLYTPFNYQNLFIYLFLKLVKSYHSLIALILPVIFIYFVICYA